MELDRFLHARKIQWIGLHGTFGEPADFNELFDELRLHAERRDLEHEIEYLAPTLYSKDFISDASTGPSESTDIAHWYKGLCAWLQEQQNRFAALPRKDIFRIGVGYSLGGRLLVPWVLDRPEDFDHVILLSCDPFKLSQDQVQQRKIWEQQIYEDILLKEPRWVIEKWNQLNLFKYDRPRKPPGSWDRELIAQAWKQWSRLHQVLVPTTMPQPNGVSWQWLYGQYDQKYKALHEQFQLQAVKGRFCEVEGVGHRLLSGAPKAVAAEIFKWL